MLTLLESKSEILAARKSLKESIFAEYTRRVVRTIGYPGGSERNADLWTDGEHWFWFIDNHAAGTPRNLNWFGQLSEHGSLNIAVEINTVPEGHSYKISGFFAKSHEGNVYLMHSGSVRGGKKGVGKDQFLAWTSMHPEPVLAKDGTIRDGIIVMPVASKGATRPLKRYVDEIAKFKLAVRSGDLESFEFKEKLRIFREYYKEGGGRRTGRRSDRIDYISRHGDVVDALKEWRIACGIPAGSKIVKNQYIDLGLEFDGRLIELFEVKTSHSTSDIYCGVGQLMIHGYEHNCKKTIVIPDSEKLNQYFELGIKKNSITILTYSVSESGDILL